MTNLHPMTVHFTLALFLTAGLFELLGWLLNKESLLQAGKWNLLLAAISAVVSVVTGLQAAEAPHNEAIHQLMVPHRLLGLTVLPMILLLAFSRFYRVILI